MIGVFRFSMQKALITGVGGFTGYYVAQELQRAGFRVFGTVQELAPVGADLFNMDLCNRDEVARVVLEVLPDVVVHLAGMAFVAHGDADNIYRTNVVGTRNLLEGLAKLPHVPRSILLASSANIYGNATAKIIDESVAPAPTNDYAVSKLAMEYMANLWKDRLPIIIARPFNYTGVGQSSQFLLPKIIGHFQRQEQVIELGNIDVERDFSDVRMVAAAYRALVMKAPIGQVFNVCSGSAVSLQRILALMAEIAGYKIDIRVNPAFVRHNEVKRLQGCSGKLSAVIGELMPIPLRETLQWMYDAR